MYLSPVSVFVLCGSHMAIQQHDSKQSDGEVPVILELWGILSTPLLHRRSTLAKSGST